ncbi:MAG: TolC family protein [Planctomycetaceae bacterium]|nr:TolC family protein [Planctomycetaceae bacterium]
MSWKKWIPLFLAGFYAVSACGCRPQQPFYLFERGNMASRYIGDGLRPEIPDTQVASIPEVTGAEAPLTLDNTDPREYWNLALQEAVRIALENGKVLRNLGGVSFGSTGAMGTPSVLLSNPYSVGTVYDPALVESDPRYGVEAALSAFDGQLNVSAGWNKIDEQQNVAGISTMFRPLVSQGDQGTFQATISKYAATGTTFYVRNNNAYDWSNAYSSRQWPSAWSTYTEAGFTQALLRGRGVTFNRIAGPGAIPGYYNGVLIARIASEKSLVDFEMGVRKMTYDVENAYWNLYYAYRNYETVKSGLRATYETYKKIHALYVAGDRRGSAQAEAQARQQFYRFFSNTKDALSNLYKTEASLRYVMGLASSDGRLIKPSDEPSVARIRFEWREVVTEGLNRAPEIRKLKWDVKQRELELIASKNFLLPQLDFSAAYRFNGLGHNLIDQHTDSASAYGAMTSGDYANWNMGLNLTAPFGWRKELAAVRNAQLNLMKYRALLQDQELELTHNLADAMRDMDRYYHLAELNFNTRIAAEAEVRATTEAYDAGTTTLDQVLDAQRRLAEAESMYFSSIINYNLAITKLHYLKGSLLEYNNVALAEGPWPGKAQFDAIREARKRDAGHYMNYGFTRPDVMSRGVVQQFQSPKQQAMPENVIYQEGDQVIYNQPSPMYDNSGYNPQYTFETLPGSVTQQPRVVPGIQQQSYTSQGSVRPVNYQADAGNQRTVFATATPQDYKNSVVRSANYYETPGQTNPISVGKINNSNGYKTTTSTTYNP